MQCINTKWEDIKLSEDEKGGRSSRIATNKLMFHHKWVKMDKVMRQTASERTQLNITELGSL